MKSFKVILWNFNRKEIEYYDVIPYFVEEWKELMSHKRRKSFHKPEGFEEIKAWLLDKSRYQFWARCEYEIVVSGFPSQNKSLKIDVHTQIQMNIDLVVDCFMEAIGIKGSAK